MGRRGWLLVVACVGLFLAGCPKESPNQLGIIEDCSGVEPDDPDVFRCCGNGKVDDRLGEECDDGNQTDGDGCTSTCKEDATVFEIEIEGPTEVAEGATIQLRAFAHYKGTLAREEITDRAMWEEVDLAAGGWIEVDDNGTVTGRLRGTRGVRVTFRNVMSPITYIRVTGAVSSLDVTPMSATIVDGAMQTFTATAHLAAGGTMDVTSLATWRSDDDTIAIVSSAGVATGISAGTTQITASYDDESNSASLTVTVPQVLSIDLLPDNPTVPKGLTQQFQLMATYSSGTIDATSMATWSTSDSSLATITSGGLATGQDVGSPMVTAMFGGMSVSTTLTVGPKQLTGITVAPDNVMLQLGQSQQYTVTAMYTDGSTAVIPPSMATWMIDAHAQIDAGGLVTTPAGSTIGSATVTAMYGGKTDTAPLMIVAAAFWYVDIVESSCAVYTGMTTSLTANAVFMDGSTMPVTSMASWSSLAPQLATVSAGVVTGVAPGAPMIRVSYMSTNDSITCTVTAAPVCGNTMVEGTEECDDGNLMSGDGCSATCTKEPYHATEYKVFAGASPRVDFVPLSPTLAMFVVTTFGSPSTQSFQMLDIPTGALGAASTVSGACNIASCKPLDATRALCTGQIGTTFDPCVIIVNTSSGARTDLSFGTPSSLDGDAAPVSVAANACVVAASDTVISLAGALCDTPSSAVQLGSNLHLTAGTAVTGGGYAAVGWVPVGAQHQEVVIRFDANMNIVWANRYDVTSGDAEPASVVEYSDKLLIAAKRDSVGSNTFFTEVATSNGALTWAETVSNLYQGPVPASTTGIVGAGADASRHFVQSVIRETDGAPLSSRIYEPTVTVTKPQTGPNGRYIDYALFGNSATHHVASLPQNGAIPNCPAFSGASTTLPVASSEAVTVTPLTLSPTSSVVMGTTRTTTSQSPITITTTNLCP